MLIILSLSLCNSVHHPTPLEHSTSIPCPGLEEKCYRQRPVASTGDPDWSEHLHLLYMLTYICVSRRQESHLTCRVAFHSLNHTP